MTDTERDDDCVSKKPWSEVLNRSLKLFTFNAAREGGRSIGKVVFFIILGIIVLMIATYIIDSVTGWFSGWFDFWPFNRAEEAVAEPEARSWWQFWGDDTPAAVVEAEPVPTAETDEVKWYCRWNPIC